MQNVQLNDWIKDRDDLGIVFEKFRRWRKVVISDGSINNVFYFFSFFDKNYQLEDRKPSNILFYEKRPLTILFIAFI